jgi:hypothetical protein
MRGDKSIPDDMFSYKPSLAPDPDPGGRGAARSVAPLRAAVCDDRAAVHPARAASARPAAPATCLPIELLDDAISKKERIAQIHYSHRAASGCSFALRNSHGHSYVINEQQRRRLEALVQFPRERIPMNRDHGMRVHGTDCFAPIEVLFLGWLLGKKANPEKHHVGFQVIELTLLSSRRSRNGDVAVRMRDMQRKYVAALVARIARRRPHLGRNVPFHYSLRPPMRAHMLRWPKCNREASKRTLRA